jgi:Mg-chelatase subunit ChlD
MRRQQGHGYAESNWISMVDLMMVLLCIGLGALALKSMPESPSRPSEPIGPIKTPEESPKTSPDPTPVGPMKVPVDEPRYPIPGPDQSPEDMKVEIDDLMRKYGDLKNANRDLEVNRNRLEDELKALKAGLSDATALNAEQYETIKGLTNAGNAPPAPPVDIPVVPDANIRQELLGISGSLDTAVFVVDRSDSMKRSGRWDDAVRTVSSWIEHLPIRRVAVVTFGSDVRTIPASDQESAALNPESREVPLATPEHREAILDALRSTSPSGATRTYDGLRRAMDFKDVDAMIVFTDGAPDSAESGSRAGDPSAQVLMLVQHWVAQSQKRHVHVVGVGDYFKGPMRDFLLGVAKAGNGTFIGR